MIELLNPINVEELRQKIASTPPFPHFCIDNFLNEEFANQIHDAFPSFEEAQSVGRGFYKVNEKKKTQIADPNLFQPPIKKLNDLLASPEFLELMSELMGIPKLMADPDLIGGGIHETGTGGHLDVHVDFNYLKKKQWHRRLNVLIYFNKDWKKEYGGYFDIWDKDVKKCGGEFAPIFNRCCAFATSEISWHGVRPVTCPPGISRKSFATYYYTLEAPESWTGEHHSTIFKPRPDEWLKGNVLMPYESSVSEVMKNLRQFKEQAKSLFFK